MGKTELETLYRRVCQLEQLAWSIFRVLETYVTFHELEAESSDLEGEEDA